MGSDRNCEQSWSFALHHALVTTVSVVMKYAALCAVSMFDAEHLDGIPPQSATAKEERYKIEVKAEY
ncbi:MAG: hypothetical protein ACHQQQ_15490 [Bacteroidota bacterium]